MTNQHPQRVCELALLDANRPLQTVSRGEKEASTSGHQQEVPTRLYVPLVKTGCISPVEMKRRIHTCSQLGIKFG
jgi:hypothetical protein